jgi:hypothetical protein
MIAKIKKRLSDYLGRRPHRSFRLTKKRDYKRSLKLPGYFKFTNYVRKTIWQNRKIFLILAIFYAVITTLMVGIASQDTYKTIFDTLRTTSGSLFTGAWGEIGKAGLLSLTAITGGLSQNLTDIQQVYAVIITLMAWLTTVWLLRNILAGNKVKVRDGLYNAGAPILPTVLVAILLIVQLLPFAIALIGYSAAASTGLLDGGVQAMLFWIAAGLLALLSLYWITSTIFALIIITLPGMYPFQAIKAAGDMVIGRRLRILLRFLWMALTVVVAWIVVMIPVIIFDSWVTSVWSATSGIPVVPVTILIMSSLTVIWVSSYVYLLYRKVIADDAGPA